jgi:hypothetical protein
MTHKLYALELGHAMQSSSCVREQSAAVMLYFTDDALCSKMLETFWSLGHWSAFILTFPNNREHPASEVYVTGTFDDWSKSEKLVKVGDSFLKDVTLPSASEKYYYKVRERSICGDQATRYRLNQPCQYIDWRLSFWQRPPSGFLQICAAKVLLRQNMCPSEGSVTLSKMVSTTLSQSFLSWRVSPSYCHNCLGAAKLS